MPASKKKYKKPLPPRDCERCGRAFIPEKWDSKLCSMDCARSRWDEAVARVKDPP